MDGFHLANVELMRLGRSGRKGAEDTFDSAGYVYAVNASGSISIYPPGSTTVLQTIPGTNYGQPTLGPDTFGTFCQ